MDGISLVAELLSVNNSEVKNSSFTKASSLLNELNKVKGTPRKPPKMCKMHI
jgi:hypothetical protein